jgi:oligopeptidase B
MKDVSDPDVLAYLKAENDYAKEIMNDKKQLKEKIYNEILSRLDVNDDSVPFKLGNYFYYSREGKGKNYLTYFRKKNIPNAEEELLLDVNEIAKDLPCCFVNWEVSPDSNILAYMVDTKGDSSSNVYFKDLRNGSLLNDVLKNVGSIEWCNDNKTLYYEIIKKNDIAKNVYRHILGTKQEEDTLIYHEKDTKFYVLPIKSNSKKYIFLYSYNLITSEYYYLDANDPKSKLIKFSSRKDNIIYRVAHNGDKFYILTNQDAPNRKVMITSIDNTDKKYWKEFIAEKENVKIEDFIMFKDFLVLVERDYGLLKMKVIKLKDDSFHYVEFPEPIYTAQLQDNSDFDSKFVRFSYESMTTLISYYDHDMEEKKNILLKEREIQGGYKKENYISERVYARASDGNLIPISLVHKKGLVKNGKNPLYIYSYGSYGISSEVYFSSVRLSLLERGFVYAIAHVRGGGELGEKWYEGGKLLTKMNTFTDFISCTEFLIKEGYSNPEQIVTFGHSAGGLLVGAIANMRPDLYKCIIADVPYVDVITSLFDLEVHNSTLHFDEIGNPHIKEHYDYIKSYSPYENIRKQNYPNMLVIAGLNDVNVPFWHAPKYVAKLRELKIDENLILLKTDLDSAHMGPSGKLDFYKGLAFEYAFILKCFGINE